MARTSKRSSVEAEIARLPDLGLAELRERWIELYGTPAPKYFRRGLLVRAIAYQIQVKAFGGLSEATKQRLARSQPRCVTAPSRRLIWSRESNPAPS